MLLLVVVVMVMVAIALLLLLLLLRVLLSLCVGREQGLAEVLQRARTHGLLIRGHHAQTLGRHSAVVQSVGRARAISASSLSCAKVAARWMMLTTAAK